LALPYIWLIGKTPCASNDLPMKPPCCICGLDLAKLSDLPENVERLINVRLMVTKRTRNGNENIFFNKRIELEAERTDIWSKDDDDIPF
jgi:hypothetical protein